MQTASYQSRRSQIEIYFDRTAADAWARLTSDLPVSSIRATVRAGRDEMRQTLLAWLPADLTGRRLLDAGCGTGAFAIEAAQRGAQVLAIDVSPSLIKIAGERCKDLVPQGSIIFEVGDMVDAQFGIFDHVVAMDSLIHYRPEDMVQSLSSLAPRIRRSMLMTFAPKTPLLAAMHLVGRAFPRGDRAPAIEPVAERSLRTRIKGEKQLLSWDIGQDRRISRGFYTSHALELIRK
ncbi:MAG: magnesium protoporphyrin IX methyltransferase [Alphaproteobacteria bacterium]|jgi:magnesium-protoporphyrin O-methyltransferase